MSKPCAPFHYVAGYAITYIYCLTLPCLLFFFFFFSSWIPRGSIRGEDLGPPPRTNKNSTECEPNYTTRDSRNATDAPRIASRTVPSKNSASASFLARHRKHQTLSNLYLKRFRSGTGGQPGDRPRGDPSSQILPYHDRAAFANSGPITASYHLLKLLDRHSTARNHHRVRPRQYRCGIRSLSSILVLCLAPFPPRLCCLRPSPPLPVVAPPPSPPLHRISPTTKRITTWISDLPPTPTPPPPSPPFRHRSSRSSRHARAPHHCSTAAEVILSRNNSTAGTTTATPLPPSRLDLLTDAAIISLSRPALHLQSSYHRFLFSIIWLVFDLLRATLQFFSTDAANLLPLVCLFFVCFGTFLAIDYLIWIIVFWVWFFSQLVMWGSLLGFGAAVYFCGIESTVEFLLPWV